MKELGVSESTERRGIANAINKNYVRFSSLGKYRYYHTNFCDFEQFKDAYINGALTSSFANAEAEARSE